MMLNIYPWQTHLHQQWLAHGKQRHHALLLAGKPGIGKHQFAYAMAASWLCQQPQQGLACQQCEACHWFNEGCHPDFKEIKPEDAEATEDSKKKTRKRQQIVVDQIRALHDYLSLSNHLVGGLRVVLIHPLELVNTTAANALLKLLEEPPAATQFILVTHQKQALLPTILSRCLQVDMPVPSQAQGMAWLNEHAVAQAEWVWHYSGGAPTTVMADNEEAAIDWHAWYAQWRPHLMKGAQLDMSQALPVLIQYGMPHAMTVLQKWLLDVQLSRHQLPVRYHPDAQASLSALAKVSQEASLLGFQTLLNRMKTTALHPLNQELQLEQCLLQYKKCFQ